MGSGTTGMWRRQAWLVCRKDLQTELRERTGLSALLLFAVTSLVIVGFALSGGSLDPSSAAALLWVVLFYAAFAGLGHSFAVEEESGTSQMLRLAASPEAVLAGKTCANFMVIAVVSVIAVPLFIAVTGLTVVQPLRLASVVVSGIAALSSAATITGAVVAKARARGVMFGALGFPIVMPLLMMAVVATRHAVSPVPGDWSWMRDVGGLISYAIMLSAASVLIFPIIWDTQ